MANIYCLCGPIFTKFKTDNACKFKAYVGLKGGYCFINVTDLAGNSRIGEPMQCK